MYKLATDNSDDKFYIHFYKYTSFLNNDFFSVYT